MPELLHLRMSDVYREKVGSLCLALESEESRTGAAEAIRALVEAIVLEPDGERLKIMLKGGTMSVRPKPHAHGTNMELRPGAICGPE
jgi:hypothetical protein